MTSTANPIDISVVMQKFTVSPSANAGLHYVLLIDMVTDLVANSAVVSAVDGEYDYTFNNVGAGQYWIYAGSDSDNDALICDPGEACGAFRTLDAPEVLNINGDRANLDFISGFPVNLFNSSVGPASLGIAPDRHQRPCGHPIEGGARSMNRRSALASAALAAALDGGCAQARHVEVMTVLANGNCQTTEIGVRAIDYATLAAFRGTRLIGMTESAESTQQPVHLIAIVPGEFPTAGYGVSLQEGAALIGRPAHDQDQDRSTTARRNARADDHAPLSGRWHRRPGGGSRQGAGRFRRGARRGGSRDVEEPPKAP